MSRPSSLSDVTKFSMILKFNGDLEAFLTTYAEQHQFRSVQELLTMLVRQYAKQHNKQHADSRCDGTGGPAELKQHAARHGSSRGGLWRSLSCQLAALF